MPPILEKLRMPIGSLVVDSALVLTLAFTAGHMTSQFTAMDQRLMVVEKQRADDRLAERMAVQERATASLDGEQDQLRIEILARLSRIEDKLDAKQDKAR